MYTKKESRPVGRFSFLLICGGVCRRLVVYAVVAEHSFDFLEYFVDAE